MIEFGPASGIRGLLEMAESSKEIDPHNANPFIAVIHRISDDGIILHETMAMELATRIPGIDPKSPYAPYLFSIVIFLLHNKSIGSYKS